MRSSFLIGAMAMLPVCVAAQEPLSAIDWLSQSVRENSVLTRPTDALEDNAPVSEGVNTDEIVVTPLDQIKKDAVGLLPASVSGLPPGFWGDTPGPVLQELIAQQSTDSLPEIQRLLYTILLAELDAPISLGSGSDVLLARIDKLLDLGALEQAQALLERAGPTEAEIFRRWFDVSLLTGREDFACKAMAAAPGFAPTLQARVFCLARNGDWNAAALTLATGESLGFITQDEADLLAWFLDPGLFEDHPDLPQPARLTPLVFTMREAIAQPRPTGQLPRAFLFADLRPSSAWRGQIVAAERLVRAGAIETGTLIHLYTAKKPAASGGVWDRAEAIQAFDVALLSGDTAMIGNTLKPAFLAMETVKLEVPFARMFGDRLVGLDLPAAQRDIGLTISLLSDGYETAPRLFEPETDTELFVLGLAQGRLGGKEPPKGALGAAISDAFRKPLPSGQMFDLLQQNRLGEAVLRAMLLLQNEAQADPGDIQTALATFRAVGLEEEARRVAIQLILLERRG